MLRVANFLRGFGSCKARLEANTYAEEILYMQHCLVSNYGNGAARGLGAAHPSRENGPCPTENLETRHLEFRRGHLVWNNPPAAASVNPAKRIPTGLGGAGGGLARGCKG